MTATQEAMLSSALAAELMSLALLEGYGHIDQSAVSVMLIDTSARNHENNREEMQLAIHGIINTNLAEMIQTAVANQRQTVAAARAALLDLQFGRNPPEPSTHDAATLPLVGKLGDDGAVRDLNTGEVIMDSDGISTPQPEWNSPVDSAVAAGAEAFAQGRQLVES